MINGGLELNENDEVMKDGNAEEKQEDREVSDLQMEQGNVSTPTASNDVIPPNGSDTVPCGLKYFTASEEAQALYDQAADPSVKTVGFA